jgi:group I intron endonuclease
MKYTVYCIQNLLNNKIYVGYTGRSVEKRWAEHARYAKHRTMDYHLYRSINLYGIDNFLFQKLEFFDNKKSALAAEISWIDLFRSWDREFGYNLTKGGESIFWTEELLDKQKNLS